jgi:hypothetical protein
MLCSLYHNIKAYYLHVALSDHSIYLTHAVRISCLLDAPCNFSNDFTQVCTIYVLYCTYLCKIIREVMRCIKKVRYTESVCKINRMIT